MPSTGIIDGGVLRLSLAGAGVSKATSCKISIKGNTRKASHKDQSGRFESNEYGDLSITISSDYLVSEGAGGVSSFITAMLAATKLAWIYGTGVSGDLKLSGTAAVIEDVNIDAKKGDNSTGSISLVIDGAMTQGTFT